MSITSSKNLMCNKLISEFNKLWVPLNRSSDSIGTQITDLVSDIDEMVASSTEDIQNASNILLNRVSDMKPSLDTESLSEIIRIINACNFLNEDNNLKDPSNAMKGAINSTFDAINNTISDLADSVGEFRISNILNSLKSKFADDGTSENMSKLDKIVNCISSICGPEFSDTVSDMIDKTSSLYSSLNMEDDPSSSSYGELKVDNIISGAGGDLKNNINGSLNSIDENKNSALDSIKDAASALKNMI